MKKFIFEDETGFQLLTANEAYALWGKKDWYNRPMYKLVSRSLLKSDNRCFEAWTLISVEDSVEDAEQILVQWVCDDDENISVYESLSDALRSLAEDSLPEDVMAERLAHLAEIADKLGE